MFVRTASIAALALLVTSGAAIAGVPAEPTTSIEVGFGDLDLSTASGERRLKSRVRMAAARVCGNPGSHGLQAMRVFQDCRSNVVAAASQDVIRAVAAARSTGPALASAGSGSITVSRAISE